MPAASWPVPEALRDTVTTEGPTPGGIRAPGLQANPDENWWARGAWSPLQAGAGAGGGRRSCAVPAFMPAWAPEVPSCDPTGPPTPTEVGVTPRPLGGRGGCRHLSSGRSRWGRQMACAVAPPLALAQGPVAMGEAGRWQAGAADHTLALPPRLPARAQPPSFLSEDRGLSPALPSPTPTLPQAVLRGHCPGDWGPSARGGARTWGLGSRCQRGAGLPVHTKVRSWLLVL